MNIIKFIRKNSFHSTLHIGYKEKYIEERVNTDFLCIQIDNHVNWKNHTEQMIPKLNRACYAVRSMVHINNINTLKSIYYAYFHSITKYEIIFGGKFSNSGIFILYRKVSELWPVHSPEPHVGLFKQLEILPVPCQYTLSLMRFTINNQQNFQRVSYIHNINTRNKLHFHRPNANLSCFQESTFHAGTKISTVYNRV